MAFGHVKRKKGQIKKNTIKKVKIESKEPKKRESESVSLVVDNTKLPDDRILQCIAPLACGKIIERDGYQCLLLEANSTIFRGLRSGSIRTVTDDRPAYFSNVDVAFLLYGHEDNDNCQVYQTKSQICLLNLFHRGNLKKLLLDKRMLEIDKDALRIMTGFGRTSIEDKNGLYCTYITRNKDEFAVCTGGFYDEFHEKNDVYISLQVGYALDALGFAGWYVADGVINRADVKKSPFHHEILLTRASTDLRLVDTANCSSFLKEV